MLSNFEINAICKYYQIPLQFIAMKEDLEFMPTRPGNYVININDEHWLGLVIDKRFSFYLDSFGAPCPKDVMRFIKRCKPAHYGHNQSILQDLDSSYCGFFVIGLFLWIKQKRYRFNSLYDCIIKYLERFKDDTKLNDQVLRDIFNELLKGQHIMPILRNKLRLFPGIK